MIQSFSFGQITIDGTTYHNDVIIYPDHVQAEWWRSEGHRLQKEDVKKIVTFKPNILMVGTGYGGLKVPAETAAHERMLSRSQCRCCSTRTLWSDYCPRNA